MTTTTDEYSLLSEDIHAVPDDWFDRQRSRYSHKFELLLTMEAQWIDILDAYQGGRVTTEQAAHAITQPLSTFPVPDFGTDTDELEPLSVLWHLFKDALVEWPYNWTPHLITLLLAISKAPSLYQNKVIRDGKCYTRQTLPWFYPVWSDAHWMQPGQITRRHANQTDRARARNIYLKQQNAESQMVAAGLLRDTLLFRYIILVLERDPSPEDNIHAYDDGVACDQLQADFHIPAVAQWMRYNKKILSQALTTGGPELWKRNRGGIAVMPKKDLTTKRWLFWNNRLNMFALDGPGELVRSAAREALGHLEDIVAVIPLDKEEEQASCETLNT